MAHEALDSFQALLERAPGWTTELEGILQTSTERQKEVLSEKQPAATPGQAFRKPSKSSSDPPRQSRDSRHHDQSVDAAEADQRGAILLRPQLPHMTESDALRLSQRKRKTSSVLSDHAGPSKFRSRAMVVVYYDGSIQKQFEGMVRAMGGNRNVLRKGKMNAKVDDLSRTGSGSSSEANSSDDRAAALSHQLKFKTTRVMATPKNAIGKDKTSEAFDKLDILLEKTQVLCEKAAHQILRDGDCALELRQAIEHLVELKKVAEDELPTLETRAEKAAERRKRERDKEKAAAGEVVGERRRTPDNLREKLENPFSSPGSLEVDLEADDSDDEEDLDFQVGAMQLGKFGIRTTRVPAFGAT